MITILTGDCRTILKTLPDHSVQCCVTSPPYWGLRDYGHTDQIGLEETPQAFVETMRGVFAEVWRVLRDDGTLWLNLGDSYSSGSGGGNGKSKSTLQGATKGASWQEGNYSRNSLAGVPPKNLIGIPWRVAFALQEDGWYLRSEITWCKRAPMPESVTDRPSTATEKIFLLTKSEKYFYDSTAVRNPLSDSFLNDPRWKAGPTEENEKNGYELAGAQNPKKLHKMFAKKYDTIRGHDSENGFHARWDGAPQKPDGSNLKNFWLLSPEPCRDAHFATFPSEIPKRCILIGSKPSDVVLDPFGGSGTTGMVALELGRKAVLIELNPTYVELIETRTNITQGLALA